MTPTPGSSLYYSLLSCTSDERLRYTRRLRFIQSLADTLFDVSEPEIAHTKIHWWHEEIERLATRKARHPAFQACEEELAGNADVAHHCLDILSVAADNRFTPPASNADVQSRLQKDYIARQALLTHALLDSPEVLAGDTFRFSALALAQGHYDGLKRLPNLLRHGYAVFSEARYSDYQMTPAQLINGVHANQPDRNDGQKIHQPEQSKALITAGIRDAHELFVSALKNPPFTDSGQLDKLLPLLTLGTLQAQQLRLWNKHPPDLLLERTTLTPLKKFFIAWRCKRKYR